MEYRGASGSLSARIVHPLGLVAKGSTWYLVAQRDGEIRTYRLSRIESAELLDRQSERPARFDLAGYWEQSTASFSERLPRYPVTLRVSPELLPAVRHGVGFTRIESIGEPESDGWCRVLFNFGVAFEAHSFVLRHGDQVEIIDPPDLREAVIQLARQILEMYQEPEQTGDVQRHKPGVV
jgi:predicted DNA-binding transcriptional regulator YafY